MRLEPRAFRLRPEIASKLNFIALRYGLNKTEVVEKAIELLENTLMAEEKATRIGNFEVFGRGNTLFIKKSEVPETKGGNSNV